MILDKKLKASNRLNLMGLKSWIRMSPSSPEALQRRSSGLSAMKFL